MYPSLPFPRAVQAKAALLDDEGNDLSDFLPDAAAQQDDTPSPAGAKRTAPDADSYSSSEDEAEAPAAADAESDAAAAVVERRRPQVIFCSRTHSQLSQFVGELHRTRFASSLLLVAVASRKALCVNDQVCQGVTGSTGWSGRQPPHTGRTTGRPTGRTTGHTQAAAFAQCGLPGGTGDAQGAAIEASSLDVWQCVGANMAAVERAGVLPLRVRVCLACRCASCRSCHR